MWFLIIFIILIVILVIIGNNRHPQQQRKKSEAIGALGESLVNNKLNKHGYLFRNYIYKDHQNNTHQIDSILVNNKGVFVIETKSYSGRIYGNENQLEWTQVLDYGKVKNHFYNPIKQNDTHCHYIKRMLPYTTSVYNIVVFTKGDISYIHSNHVIGINILDRVLKAFPNKYNEEEIKEFIDLINKYRDRETTNYEHAYNVQEKLRKREYDRINHNYGLCPRCGRRLVLRHSKYGDFIGCENYPKCTYIEKL